MSLQRIIGLRADIVPHSQWATRKWFYAEPLWYYHRAGTDEEIVAGRKFYELVDPELRQLCHILNERGLHTTPSCQGHFHPRDHFEKVWEQLTRERDRIVGEGLVVKDSETDGQYLFRQCDYALPWKRFNSFYAQAGEHQGTGYLGIVVPEDRPRLIEALCGMSGRRGIVTSGFDERIGPALGGRLYNIVVRPSSGAERAAAWSDVTRALRELLRHDAVFARDGHGGAVSACDASAIVWRT